MTNVCFFSCSDLETSHAPATSVTNSTPPTVQLVTPLKNQKLVKETVTPTKGTNLAYQSCVHLLAHQKTESCCRQRMLTTLAILSNSNVILDL